MMEVLRKTNRFRVMVLTALVILAPFLAYNFLYVSNQTAYFTDRNFRILANFSGLVKEKVEGLSVVSANAAQAAVKSNDISLESFSGILKPLRTEGTKLTASDVRPVGPVEPSPDSSTPHTKVAVKSEGGDSWLYFETD